MKRKLGKYIFASAFIGFFCLSPEPVFSNPSNIFEEKLECIENPDFVTPSNQEFKYCIKDNGEITKIDKSGSLVDEEYKIDELIEEKKKKGFAYRKKQLVEFKIDEDELFKYSCDSKKEKGEVICDGESKRSLLGIRPEGYFLSKGLKEIEDEKWNKSIEYLDKEIENSKNQEAYSNRGYAKFVLGDYLGSIKDLNSALEKDKTDISALSLRSRANFEINNYKGVISDIDSLIKLLDKKSEEEIIELSEKEINPIKTDYYYLRGLAKSEIGDFDGAKKDFDAEIKKNPMNGDAYFQRGLEGYWIDRDKACSDLLKGISLGAKDTSMKLVKERAKTESFLDELFTSQKTLVDACKDSSDEKIEKNKQNYESENFRRDLSELFKKYFYIIPILALVIFFIVMKYRSNDE